MARVIAEPKTGWNLIRNWPLHVMLIPAVILTIIFQYIPMGGVVMAFQDFKPWLSVFNSPWVGWKNFETLFNRPDSVQVLWNTFIIAIMKIIAGLIAPFSFALMLNEVRNALLKRSVQTLVYLPHFLSWVVLGGIMIDLLSSEGGLINQVISWIFKTEPVFFLGNGDWFRFTVVVSHVWKEFGFGTIVFLASLASVNPALYEAALMDGANRWKQTLHITIPAMMPIAIVLATLALGQVLNAGFDQIFNLYNPLVYEKGDIIDTFVYRVAIVGSRGRP